MQDCRTGLEGKIEDFEETWKIVEKHMENWGMGPLKLKCFLGRLNQAGHW